MKAMKDKHYRHRHFAQNSIKIMADHCHSCCPSALLKNKNISKKCFQFVTWIHQQSWQSEPILDFALIRSGWEVVKEHKHPVSSTNRSVMAHASFPIGRRPETHCTLEIVGLFSILKLLRNILHLRGVKHRREIWFNVTVSSNDILPRSNKSTSWTAVTSILE